MTAMIPASGDSAGLIDLAICDAVVEPASGSVTVTGEVICYAPLDLVYVKLTVIQDRGKHPRFGYAFNDQLVYGGFPQTIHSSEKRITSRPASIEAFAYTLNCTEESVNYEALLRP